MKHTKAQMSLMSRKVRDACQAISSDIKSRRAPGTGKAGVDRTSCSADPDTCPHSAASRRGAGNQALGRGNLSELRGESCARGADAASLGGRRTPRRTVSQAAEPAGAREV